MGIFSWIIMGLIVGAPAKFLMPGLPLYSHVAGYPRYASAGMSRIQINQ